MRLPLFEKLYTHMEWADAFVWRSVLEVESVRGDDYVIESLVHLHMVQRAYLAVWTGKTVTTPNRDDFGDVTAIRDWGRSYYAEAVGFLRGLTEARLAEAIPIPWTGFVEKQIGGPLSPATLGDMVYQVAAHSAHHRAQINHRIREVGGEPGMVDYIGWIWRGAPTADWSA